MVSTAPCRSCKASVRIEKRNAPRRLGQTQPDTVLVRVCTNPDCATNDPRRRKLGQVV